MVLCRFICWARSALAEIGMRLPSGARCRYQHTGVDTSLQDGKGRHNSALFVCPGEHACITACCDCHRRRAHGSLCDSDRLPQRCRLDHRAVPFQPAGSSWDNELSGYVDHLLSIADRFAPGVAAADTILASPTEFCLRFLHFGPRQDIVSESAGMSSQVVDTFALPPPKIEEYFGITRGHIHHMQSGTFSFDKRMPTSPMQASNAKQKAPKPPPAICYRPD